MLAVNPEIVTHRIVIVPNRSLNLAGLLVFYTSISAVTLGLAVSLTIKDGYWPMLAWAIVELVLVGACQYWCWRQGGYGECVTVDGERITVEKGTQRHRERAEFNRYWSQVVVQEPGTRLHPKRLFIRSHGKLCEIGRCLTEEERNALAHRLAGLIGAMGNTDAG
ncbi:MAG: DUF2244 domain-containing protein [Gammaproteobacteria bacterium]